MTKSIAATLKTAKAKAKKTPPHLMISARAGTGKTTTLVEGLKVLKGLPTAFTPSEQQAAIWASLALSKDARTVCFVAFNKSIATELASRIPSGCEAMTMHSMGFKAVNRAFNKLRVNEHRVTDLIAKEMGRDIYDLRKEKPTLLAATKKLVGLVKMNLAETTIESLTELASHYDVEMENCRGEVFDLVPKIVDRCRDPLADGCLDFDDMVWLPVALDLPMFRYDLLLVDECIPGWTPVMLADGRSMTIKEIVESKEEIRVRAYDTEKGVGRNCRVIGRQKILNQKSLVKVRVRHFHKTGTNKKCNFVICTIDHKIWTINRGWVPAGEIRIGDDVIIETAAKTTQKGKITKDGREKLAQLQLGNKRGLGNVGGSSAEAFNRIKGGNGRGMSLAESTLLAALNSAWPEGTWGFGHVVRTGDAPQFGRGDKPTHYKLDIAFPDAKITVEVDGHSHRGREEQDQKKEEFLASQGWAVIRVTNRRAIQDTANVVEEILAVSETVPVCEGDDCPRPARVIEVVPITIPDSYVYDITVEDCHNFYANGILVHNCQDLNRCQQAIAKKCGTRLVFCGDERQAIYGFAGADSESMPRLAKELKANVLPLTVTRRCGKAIVEEAKRYVPDFSAFVTNPEGVVRQALYPIQPGAAYKEKVDIRVDKSYLAEVRDGDFVVCRSNAPLVNQCFKMIRMGKKATIQGRDVGQGLISLVKKLDARTVPELVTKLNQWTARELDKENAKKNPSETRIQGIEDKSECLMAFIDNAATVDGVVRKIEELFTDRKDQPGVRLSSIHKAKGLESQRVYFLRPAVQPVNQRQQKAWVTDQEANLVYVAITRAISELVMVY